MAASRRPVGRRHRLGWLIVNRVCVNPAFFLVFVWAAWLLLSTVGPTRPVKSLNARTILTIVQCLLLFAAGCLVHFAVSRSRGRRRAARPLPAPVLAESMGPSFLRILVRNTALLGLFGGLCIAGAKILFSGIDYSGGFAAARVERVATLVQDRTTSPLVAVGLVTYCFSYVSFLVAILRAEYLRRSSIYLACGSLAGPLVVDILYGGRSFVFLTAMCTAAAFVLRSLRGLRPLGGLRPSVRLIFVGLGLIMVVHNSITLQSRRAYFQRDELSAQIEAIERNNVSVVKPWVSRAVNSGYVPANMMSDYLSVHLYLVEGPHNLNGALNSPRPLGPYYGRLGIPILDTVAARLDGSGGTSRLEAELYVADLGGAFMSALGTLYLDFGWFGLVMVIFLMGVLSQKYWRRALTSVDLPSDLVMCYLFAAIAFSPLHSLFGVLGGMFLIVDIVLAGAYIRRKRRRLLRTARRSPLSAAPRTAELASVPGGIRPMPSTGGAFHAFD